MSENKNGKKQDSDLLTEADKGTRISPLDGRPYLPAEVVRRKKRDAAQRLATKKKEDKHTNEEERGDEK